MIERRGMLAGAGALALTATRPGAAQTPAPGPGPNLAQAAWPERPVRLVIGYPAGGPTDFAARLLQPHLQALWGQPLVIENRAGANGIIGSEAVARAAPDGYTLLLGNSPNTINPAIQPRMPFDSLADLAPVVLIYFSPTVLFAGPETKLHTLADVVAAAKAQPGMAYAVSGMGSPGHFAGEVFKLAAKIDITPIAYRGAPPALADVVGGRVAITFSTLSGAIALMRDGKLRPIAVSGPDRIESLPGVPTFVESGFDVADTNGWYGIIAPAGTPAPIQQKVADDIAGLLARPEIRQRFLDSAAIPLAEGPAAFTARYRAEIGRWTAIARAADIKAE